MNKIWLAAGAALAMTSAAALASVNFDSNSGTGFVGKGDVQLAFGWNNKAAQDNANRVVFSYDVNDTYDVTCEWETTTGGPRPKTIVHDVTVPKHVKVNAGVSYEARQKNQYTGYILNGFGTSSSEGTVPSVGGSCPNGGDGVIVDVLLTSGGGGGMLYVTFNGNKVALPNTPVVTI